MVISDSGTSKSLLIPLRINSGVNLSLELGIVDIKLSTEICLQKNNGVYCMHFIICFASPKIQLQKQDKNDAVKIITQFAIQLLRTIFGI